MNGFNIFNSFHQKIWQEQFCAMERGFKLEERKILFVIALFGIGSYGILQNKSEVAFLYYLVPLISVAFDVLIALQKHSVRRIGIFLRLHSVYVQEQLWEKFVSNKRDKFLRYGTDAFTLLTFLASLWMVFRFIHGEDFSKIHTAEYIWFSVIFIGGVFTRWRCKKEIDKLESAVEE